MARDLRYAGILFFAWRVNLRDGSDECVLLLGREHQQQGWHDSGKWSPFGGAPEFDTVDADVEFAAAREAYEESMGMLGSARALHDAIRVRGIGVKTGEHGILYLVEVAYDPHLPTYFGRVYDYLSACVEEHPTRPGYRCLAGCPEGYYEKIAVAWVSARAVAQIAAKESSRTLREHVTHNVLRRKFALTFQDVIDAVPWMFVS